MKLNSLIDAALDDPRIFDVSGEELGRQRILDEFEAIKAYLLVNYSKQDRLALYLQKDARYLLVMLACMRIGLTYIPLKKQWPEARVRQIQSISGCDIIIDETIQDLLEDKEGKKPDIDTFGVSDKDILYIMFTSGTTGAPKGVMIRRESYHNYVSWMDSFYEGIHARDRLLLTTDFTFDMSMGDIGFFLIRHVDLYISSFSNDIFQLLFELEKYEITMHRTVPYTYTMLTAYHGLDSVDLSKLKLLVFAGSRFPYSLYQTLEEKFPQTTVCNLYGPTESTIDVLAERLSFKELDVVDHNVSVGKAITNNDIRLVDNEICVSGIQVMEGYLNDPERTDDVMVTIDGKRYYRTGDLAFQDEKGRYFIVGRTDDTVKVAGFRVNLLDIDAYITDLSYVHDAATVLMEDDRTGDSHLVTFLILKTPKEKKEILIDLRNRLLPYQVARKLVVLDAFPLNANGKVDRKALKATLSK